MGKGRGQGNLRGQQVPSQEGEEEEEDQGKGHGNRQGRQVTNREVGEVWEDDDEISREQEKGHRRGVDMTARHVVVDGRDSTSQHEHRHPTMKAGNIGYSHCPIVSKRFQYYHPLLDLP